MSGPMVKAEAVHKRFGRLEVLKGLWLEVAPKEVCCRGSVRTGRSLARRQRGPIADRAFVLRQ